MLIAGLHLPKSVWMFYALGPQLVLCLGLGFQAWRRRGGDLLHWLTLSFVVAPVPVAGVVVMAWLWWRSPPLPADAPRVSPSRLVQEQLGRRYVRPVADDPGTDRPGPEAGSSDTAAPGTARAAAEHNGGDTAPPQEPRAPNDGPSPHDSATPRDTATPHDRPRRATRHRATPPPRTTVPPRTRRWRRATSRRRDRRPRRARARRPARGLRPGLGVLRPAPAARAARRRLPGAGAARAAG